MGSGGRVGSCSVYLRGMEFSCERGRMLRNMGLGVRDKAMGTLIKPDKDKGSAVTGLVTSL